MRELGTTITRGGKYYLASLVAEESSTCYTEVNVVSLPQMLYPDRFIICSYMKRTNYFDIRFQLCPNQAAFRSGVPSVDYACLRWVQLCSTSRSTRTHNTGCGTFYQESCNCSIHWPNITLSHIRAYFSSHASSTCGSLTKRHDVAFDRMYKCC